jgi:hypothetical protein
MPKLECIRLPETLGNSGNLTKGSDMKTTILGVMVSVAMAGAAVAAHNNPWTDDLNTVLSKAHDTNQAKSEGKPGQDEMRGNMNQNVSANAGAGHGTAGSADVGGQHGGGQGQGGAGGQGGHGGGAGGHGGGQGGPGNGR